MSTRQSNYQWMAAHCLLRPKRVLFLRHSPVARFHQQCRTHGIGNAGLDPLFVPFGFAGAAGGVIVFAQAAIRDIDLPRSVDFLFLQIGGNEYNSATCVSTQLARYILHVARDSINLGGVVKVGICQLLYRVSSSRLRGADRHPLRLGYNRSVDDVSNELRRLIAFSPGSLHNTTPCTYSRPQRL